ncbi:MAG: hypothetical protein FWG87_12155 [Defluviitaleaceae bacterium]|nr:hypothetical protein [Defluviitaleaceae bacterium]
MEYRQTMGSAALSEVINLPPMLRNRQVEIIVLPAAEPTATRKFDFLADKIPPLPDSFFEPLPEEELQAWGL